MTGPNPLVESGNQQLRQEVLDSERGGSGWDGFHWHIAVGMLSAVLSATGLHFGTNLEAKQVVTFAAVIGFVAFAAHALTPAKRD